jgi:hypothetical protein
VGVLKIERVDVHPEHIEALVRVTDRHFASTAAAPGLPGRALGILPGLARHSCENGSAHGHIAELADTETPHLLEHVACELMALSGSPRTLRGETAWDFAADGPGVFRVRLAYDDDLACLGALRNGVDVVEWLLGRSADEPDVERIVTELVAVRQRPS